MSDYLHGAYGDSRSSGNRVAADSGSAIVCIGTAPVHQVALGSGETYNVNRPVLVQNMADMKKYFGYSDAWDKYTVCEAAHHFFENKGVGPLIMINVMNPNVHYETAEAAKTATPADGAVTIANAGGYVDGSISVEGKTEGTDYTTAYDAETDTLVLTEKTAGSLGTSELTITYTAKKSYSASLTPVNGAIALTNAEDVILESVAVATKTKGTDYAVAYNTAKKAIVITELTSGALGTSALTVTYNKVDATKVTSADVIGTTDNAGTNTGCYAVKNVYTLTQIIPAYIIAPGWTSTPAINTALCTVAQKINSHWDAWVFADLPITNGSTPLTMATAVTYKNTNGYTKENETVYFPMVTGTDEKHYHLSVLASANFLELLSQNDGVPYHTASNTDVEIVAHLYFGSDDDERVFDDEIINENLNKNGIASACFAGGRWAVWGAHAADYNQSDADYVNVAETARMMLFYICNDFQRRRPKNVDKPLTSNDIASIVAEEQNRLDALKAMGAIISGTAVIDAESISNSDVYNGDFVFTFRVTTTPLAKSLKAVVTWVDEGFSTYYGSMTE